jgi:hypothetical protein
MNKYRPSNGTEGDFFMDKFCFRCRNDSEDAQCSLLIASMVFDVDDPEYPSEWVQNEDGIGGYCTAFEEATDE